MEDDYVIVLGHCARAADFNFEYVPAATSIYKFCSISLMTREDIRYMYSSHHIVTTASCRGTRNYFPRCRKSRDLEI